MKLVRFLNMTVFTLHDRFTAFIKPSSVTALSWLRLWNLSGAGRSVYGSGQEWEYKKYSYTHLQS